MGRRLREEDVVKIEVLQERGLANRAIARKLRVSEHAIEYQLRHRSRRRPGRSAERQLLRFGGR